MSSMSLQLPAAGSRNWKLVAGSRKPETGKLEAGSRKAGSWKPEAGSCLQLLQLLLHSVRHRLERPVSAAERALTGIVHHVVLPPPTAALGSGLSDVRHHHLLFLEPCQRHVNTANRHVPICALADF